MPTLIESLPVDQPVAVVTGGAGDIGGAIGAALLRSGYAVALVDIRGAAVGVNLADDVAERAAVPTGQIAYATLDVTDAAATAALVERLPRLDLVVANAGIVDAQPFLEIDIARWRNQIEVNLTGAFVTAQAGARRMVADAARGAIVFTSSWVATRPWPGIAAYASSKGGLEQLMRQAALELSPHGIRANAVAPGIVRAGMAKHQLETEPDYAARVATAVPLGELQTAEQIAAAVAFLSSPAASSMDGSVLLVDNGSSLGTLS